MSALALHSILRPQRSLSILGGLDGGLRRAELSIENKAAESPSAGSVLKVCSRRTGGR
jgi:hypothetical protein